MNQYAIVKLGKDAPAAEPVEIAARIPELDYFGCDGRPWDAEADSKFVKDGAWESGMGKELLGKGERFLQLAKENGKKGLFLMENHKCPQVR